MNNSIVYYMDVIDNFESDKKYTVIIAPNHEQRSTTSFNILENKVNIDKIIEIDYSGCSFSDEIRNKYRDRISFIDIKSNIDFIYTLNKLDSALFYNDVIVDITGIKIPEMFSLFKFLKLNTEKTKVQVVYSMPYDYIFSDKPFTSYKTYNGDLEICEPIGYSGNSSEEEKSKLFMFLGFEGALSLKVTEDFSYNSLYLINNLPSFYSKYKDISVLNNYDIINADRKMYYTAADNPFDTFNFLNKMISKDEIVCIAPLSTKPVALGVCLYALNNSNVRIVYPIANSYKNNNSIDTYKSYIYSIPLDELNI